MNTETRLECLRLAVQKLGGSGDALAEAQRYLDFVCPRPASVNQLAGNQLGNQLGNLQAMHPAAKLG